MVYYTERVTAICRYISQQNRLGFRLLDVVQITSYVFQKFHLRLLLQHHVFLVYLFFISAWVLEFFSLTVVTYLTQFYNLLLTRFLLWCYYIFITSIILYYINSIIFFIFIRIFDYVLRRNLMSICNSLYKSYIIKAKLQMYRSTNQYNINTEYVPTKHFLFTLSVVKIKIQIVI